MKQKLLRAISDSLLNELTSPQEILRLTFLQPLRFLYLAFQHATRPQTYFISYDPPFSRRNEKCTIYGKLNVFQLNKSFYRKHSDRFPPLRWLR
jgi:hypothetical protein